MSKLFRLFVTIAMTIFFVGCRIQYIPVPVETKIDSVYVEKIVERVDTLKIEIPQEVQVLIAKTDSSRLETSVAVSEAVVDSTGLLHHRLENKKGALEKQIVYKDKIVEKRVEIEKEVPVEVEVPVKYVPGYYKWINGIFWCLVGLIGLFVGLKIYFKR